MRAPPPARRVIIVVLDGLRPDAVDAFDLRHFRALTALGAYTPRARTVTPSVTAAAMGSLLTGVPPTQHGLTSDRFHVPRRRGPVEPLPALVAEAGLPVSGFVRELPLPFRPMGRVIAGLLGVETPSFAGRDAAGITRAAATALRDQRDGLLVLHWPDVDVAGHAHGWMSPAYGDACRTLEALLWQVVEETGAVDDDETLLIALADHGGGGVRANDHEGDHPANWSIPLLLLGGAVQRGELPDPVSLLDVAPTAAWALGLTPPAGWSGRALRHLMVPAHAA